jgi:RNA polymerase sigma factor (sigma-70 family)
LETARQDLEAALEERHADSLGWAMTCCYGNLSDAEDVLQSTYLKILEGRAVFGGRSSFRSWLFGVIRRTAAEHRRWRWLSRMWSNRGLEYLQLEDPSPDSATVLVRSETTARLTSALALLARRQREVLHLVFYQNLTIEEAAVALGISVGTARTHYERGKSRLRARLGLESDA